MSDRKAVIIDAVRSPIGVKRGKMPNNVRSDDLTSQVIKALLERNRDFSPAAIEDVVLGCAFPEGPQGMLMARSVAILAGRGRFPFWTYNTSRWHLYSDRKLSQYHPSDSQHSLSQPPLPKRRPVSAFFGILHLIFVSLQS